MWFWVSCVGTGVVVKLSLSSVSLFCLCLEGPDGPRDIVVSSFSALADSRALIGPIQLFSSCKLLSVIKLLRCGVPIHLLQSHDNYYYNYIMGRTQRRSIKSSETEDVLRKAVLAYQVAQDSGLGGNSIRNIADEYGVPYVTVWWRING